MRINNDPEKPFLYIRHTRRVFILLEYWLLDRDFPPGQDEPAADEFDRRRDRGDYRRDKRGEYLYLSEGLGEATARHEERSSG